MTVAGMPIPEELVSLIDSGRWPRLNTGEDETEVIFRQVSAPLVSSALVRRIAPEHSYIALYPPPFRTAEWLMRPDVPELTAYFTGVPDSDLPPGDIIPPQTVLIADFGIGSDALIALDYRNGLDSPSVIRLLGRGLTWSRWVHTAPTFARVSELLEL